MTVKAVTNSTCLIGLERIERLNILPQVEVATPGVSPGVYDDRFDTVFAPPAVAKEVRTSYSDRVFESLSRFLGLIFKAGES